MQSFYRSIMVMDYQFHLPEYLAKCINRDQPQLHCDGQCILMQKINDKEQGEASKNFVNYEYSSLYVHRECVIFDMDIPDEESMKNDFSPYVADYVFQYHSPVFRPPIC